MQAYATAGLYSSQLTQNYTSMAQMALANNASRALPISGLGVSLGKGSSLNGLTFGDAFTPQDNSAASLLADSSIAVKGLSKPMLTLAQIGQEGKRLNILQIISSVFEQIYATMLKALGRKPDASGNQDGPTE